MNETIHIHENREALLVKLAKLLDLTPSSFLKIDHNLRRSSTIGVLNAMLLFSPVSENVKKKIDQIWAAGIDAGVLIPEDSKEIFK